MRVYRFGKHVTKYLSAYFHGAMPAEAAQQVKAHLASCGRCQKKYEEIKIGIKLAEQLHVVAAPVVLWSGVMEKLDGAKKQPGPGTAWRFALAASAIILVMLTGWWAVHKKQNGATNRVQHGKSEPEFSQPSSAPIPSVNNNPIVTPPTSPKFNGTQTARSNLTWEVASLTGAPRIGDAKIKDTGKLGVGEWLETDNASSAKIKVAEIGYVDIDPNSRVQLVQTKDTEHRIALARGKISALILAPPRLFIVDTPSATAVDLGCAYTLEVDEFGASLLRVTSGWVSFVRNGRESFIPAGAMCATRKGIGVGTPYFDESSSEFKRALHALDFQPDTKAELAIGALLTEARTEDALTLWHLLSRRYHDRTAELRARIYDRLVEFVPPPEGVTRSGVVNGNQKMLDLWWEEKIR